jgi:CelD/BcsL family acetyltransferase involved in cellulose biosynthesis
MTSSETMTPPADVAMPTLAMLNPDAARWRDFVDSRPDALPFHHPAWMTTLAESYGYRSFVLGLDDDGGLAGGLPMMQVRKRWISLPFTDYCPPLGIAGPRLAELLDEARLRGGVARVELRAELEGAYADAGAVRHVLALDPDPAAILRTFHRSQVQRNIKRAERSGVVVRRARSIADLTDRFYGLHVGTRRRLGVPVQPRRFFARLWERMIEPGLGFVLLAEAGDRPVAGAVFLAYGETVIYKFGASDAGSWGLRPNHALFWDAIRASCEDGHRWFDFGRTDLEDAGLRRFKAWWGSEEIPLTYATLADRPPGRKRSGRALAPVIRHSPPWVGRAIGELLYKHAA